MWFPINFSACPFHPGEAVHPADGDSRGREGKAAPVAGGATEPAGTDPSAEGPRTPKKSPVLADHGDANL